MKSYYMHRYPLKSVWKTGVKPHSKKDLLFNDNMITKNAFLQSFPLIAIIVEFCTEIGYELMASTPWEMESHRQPPTRNFIEWKVIAKHIPSSALFYLLFLNLSLFSLFPLSSELIHHIKVRHCRLLKVGSLPWWQANISSNWHLSSLPLPGVPFREAPEARNPWMRNS